MYLARCLEARVPGLSQSLYDAFWTSHLVRFYPPCLGPQRPVTELCDSPGPGVLPRTRSQKFYQHLIFNPIPKCSLVQPSVKPQSLVIPEPQSMPLLFLRTWEQEENLYLSLIKKVVGRVLCKPRRNRDSQRKEWLLLSNTTQGAGKTATKTAHCFFTVRRLGVPQALGRTAIVVRLETRLAASG